MVGIAWNESRDAVATTCRRSRQGYQVGVKNGQCILIHPDVSQVVVHRREEEPATRGAGPDSPTKPQIPPPKNQRIWGPPSPAPTPSKERPIPISPETF